MLEESEAAADVSGEVDGGYLAEIGVGLAEGVGVRGEVEGKMEGGEACLPVEESAEELCGMFGPAQGCPGIRAWGAWAGCRHFEDCFPGVWSTFVYFMAILGVSEAASRMSIAIVSFVLRQTLMKNIVPKYDTMS